MPQVADLISLQEHDDILARLNDELAEAQREIKNDDALQAARATAADADSRCEGLAREQRRLEGDISSLDERIAREEGRLYDGSVNLPKELAGIQQEVAALKARRSQVEDTELALLDEAEGAEVERSDAHGALDREQAAWEGKKERLTATISRLEQEIGDTTTQRDACRERLPGTIRTQYEDLRRRRGGVAVARLQGSVCSACRVGVHPSARKRALDPETPALCPNCGCILVGSPGQ